MKNQRRWEYLRKAPLIASQILLQGKYDFEYDLMDCHSTGMTFSKRLNLLRSGGNLIYRNSSTWSMPIHCHFELTNYCNLKCPVCPTGSGMLRRPPRAMDPALFERLMKEMGPFLLTASLWGWGESLLHPELAAILRLQHNRGINTFLSTNGQNLNDPKVLEALIKYPPTHLIVALDGASNETLSEFRKGASLQPALEGVRQLAKMKASRNSKLPVLHHRFIAMKHNEHEVAGVPEFSARNQFDILDIRTLSIIDAPEDAFNQLKSTREELNAYKYQAGRRLRRNDYICEKAFIFPAVFSDGTVVACDQDCQAQKSYGSMADGTTFREIWRSRQAAEIRRTIRDNPDSYSFCRNCPFKDRPTSDCNIKRIDLKKT